MLKIWKFPKACGHKGREWGGRRGGPEKRSMALKNSSTLYVLLLVATTYTSMHTQGLHPESHGIVNNYFYDTVLQDKFYIGVQNQNDPKWWLGEPVSKLGNKLLRHRYD
jgi:hypothetical protein